MSKIDEQASETPPAFIDDVEIAQYILEMILQMSRLAVRSGDRELASDLYTVVARAEERRKRRLN